MRTSPLAVERDEANLGMCFFHSLAPEVPFVLCGIEEKPIDGDRYEFEVFIESPESARKRGEDLRPLLQEGIPHVESETFRRVKRDIFGVDG